MTRGSFGIELLLWLCLLLPGIIYSLWRISTRYQVCGECGSREMVPVNSRIGRAFVRDTLKLDPGWVEAASYTELRTAEREQKRPGRPQKTRPTSEMTLAERLRQPD